MPDLPSFSIVTACFNAAATLPDTLASVASQRGVEVEHWVLDGGSSDETRTILEAQPSTALRWSSEADRGVYDALNKGFERTTGEIVGLLHADDVFAGPDVLCEVAQAFSDPATQAVYGDLQYVRRDAPERVVRHWVSGEFSRKRLAFGWMPPHPTLFMRRSVWERVGPFDLRYRIAADYEHMLRLLTGPERVVRYLPKVLVRMRLGGLSNRSLRHMWLKSSEDLRAMRAHGVGGLATLAAKNLRKLPQFLG